MLYNDGVGSKLSYTSMSPEIGGVAEYNFTPSSRLSVGSMYSDPNTPTDLNSPNILDNGWLDLRKNSFNDFSLGNFANPNFAPIQVSTGAFDFAPMNPTTESSQFMMGGTPTHYSKPHAFLSVDQLLTTSHNNVMLEKLQGLGSNMQSPLQLVQSWDLFKIPKVELEAVKEEISDTQATNLESSGASFNVLNQNLPLPLFNSPAQTSEFSKIMESLSTKLFPTDVSQSFIKYEPDQVVPTDVKPSIINQKTPRYSKNGRLIGRPPGTYKFAKQTKSINNENGEVRVCEWNGCKAQFTDELLFHAHVRTHMSESDMTAQHCKWDGCLETKPFQFYLLLAHVRKHTREKPYECNFPVCDKRYSRKENLKTHFRTHTGEKPYSCSLCGKQFTNASDCAKHVNRTHSDEKPYVCMGPECIKRYTDPSSLRKHFKKCHAEFMDEFRAGRYRLKRISPNNNKESIARTIKNHYHDHKPSTTPPKMFPMTTLPATLPAINSLASPPLSFLDLTLKTAHILNTTVSEAFKCVITDETLCKDFLEKVSQPPLLLEILSSKTLTLSTKYSNFPVSSSFNYPIPCISALKTE
ncbi:hypothetical protein L5515_019262 [Caenorhabditis briggsae]|uniref:C2H2-type domain-containing protein n=1 Tax=Caenorhabditis briggsae TaxID=6238 RepID=A0AAE9FLB2_CAEBR|nr:hypothetical protein L5515_019262 [Caenorhabditis briggsae]